MIPLAKQALCIDACILQSVDGRNRHVRVDVPIVHALNQVNAALVIFDHSVEEITFCPIITCNFRTKNVGRNASSGPYEIIWAYVLVIFLITVDSVGPIDTIVHDGGTGFRRAVSPHQFLDTDETRDWHDCLEVIMLCSKHSSLPRCAAVVGFSNHANSAVGPILFPKPANCCIVAELLCVAHEVHTVVRATRTGN